MTPKINIYRSGELIYEADGILGETLLERIAASGVFLDAPCGGMGRCGKCHVQLSPGGEDVLACLTIISGGMDVYLPDELDMEIAGADGVDAKGAYIDSKHLGVAVDIGTTSVVAHLTDLDTCTRLATASGVNAQRAYGADVLSRIQYCTDNGHDTLTRVIRDQLKSLILDACASAGVSANDVGYIVIAANTIMQHLVAGYSPVRMGVAPFATESLFGEELPAWDDLPIRKGAKIYYTPAISAYVGGDITAGMLAAGLEDTKGPAVFLDVGTNGEIVLKHGDTYYCCATAAGPAFEGAEISMGMAAVSGAVNKVQWDDGLKVGVIGDVAPRGLCGSGLLDALAVLLDTGAVDETGRLLEPEEINHAIAKHIAIVDGKPAFQLTDDGSVYLTGEDIRKLQLAKSAIAAGIQTLLHHAGVEETDVKSFILAGGFGSFMDQSSAATIGLFPRCFLPVAKTMGNTAGEGAAIALCCEAARLEMLDMRRRCEYIELSTSAYFNEQFIENILFDVG